MTTRASAVATSWRPRRPSQPMPSAPASENTPSPISVLMPSRLAPAAPANAPCGTASATNAEPRSTTKKPTTPATTATIVATTQVLTMNPENMPVTPPPAGCGRAPPPGTAPAWPRRGQIAEEDQRDDEEADRPALPGRRPVVAVVGQQHAQPAGGQADERRARPWPAPAGWSAAARSRRARSAARCSASRRWSCADSDTASAMRDQAQQRRSAARGPRAPRPGRRLTELSSSGR